MPARTYPWEMFAASADLLAERLGATISSPARRTSAR